MSSTNKNEVYTLFHQRHSVRHFDPTHTLHKTEIEELLEVAGSAPSSWNLQHWKFLAIIEKNAKQKLLPIANGQKQVVGAAVTVAVLGDLEANRNAEAVFQPVIEAENGGSLAGYDTYQTLISQITNAYTYGSATYKRDEAIRNASLAAMQLMLAAQAKGLDSGPMVGFDAEAFVQAFDVPRRYLPVLLIAIGKAIKPARPTTRFSVEQTVVWNGFKSIETNK